MIDSDQENLFRFFISEHLETILLLDLKRALTDWSFNWFEALWSEKMWNKKEDCF